MYRFILSALLVIALTFSAQSQSEQKKQLGEWDVHYIAFPAPLLTPEIARQYQLQRSKYNGIINISVLDKNTQAAQKVTLRGSAKDLQGRVKQLEFNQVVEGDAVYYLSELPFHHEQRYSFSIEITGLNSTQTLKFDQTFYVD